VLGEQILGKPLDFNRAKAQLMAASGGSVTFLTGLALLNSDTGRCQLDVVPFTVHFRQMDEEQIGRYLEAEQPYDCAGSFKAEGLGVSLFRATEGADATSLVGLPLIRLVEMLAEEGIAIP
jgi:MAF protein